MYIDNYRNIFDKIVFLMILIGKLPIEKKIQ